MTNFDRIGRNGGQRLPARPVAMLVTGALDGQLARQLHALHGMDLHVWSPRSGSEAPTDPRRFELLLVETRGLSAAEAASLFDLAEAWHAVRSRQTILICTTGHLDLLGTLAGTGMTVLCDPAPREIEDVLACCAQAIWRDSRRRALSRNRDSSLTRPAPCPWPQAEMTSRPRPYWLDLLSDLLTGIAIARQAGEPGAQAIAAILQGAANDILALADETSLLDALATARQDEGGAELALLLGEIERRSRPQAPSQKH